MAIEQKLDKDTKKWIDEQEKLMAEGESIIQEASNEALEYMADAVNNLGDRAWRKMVMSTQAVEMGIGVGIAEHLVPVIYGGMEKKLSKQLKLPKETARALRHIYIGRVVKNIRRKLNERDK